MELAKRIAEELDRRLFSGRRDGPDLKESSERIIASHIAPLETALERLREEALWVRNKLGLPEEATFIGPGRPTLAGAMHVVCSHAHGYETYILAGKCDDKQGEIARLTVDNAALRKQVEELRNMACRQREDARYYGLDYTDAMRVADLRMLQDAALSAQAEACTGEST